MKRTAFHYFKTKAYLGLTLLGLLAISLSDSGRVVAQESDALSLKARPVRCIALHKGQVCYQKTRLSWQAPFADNYCLYQKQLAAPIKCWQEVNHGIYAFDFQSDRSLEYVIRRDGEDIVLMETKITVAWVYNSGKKRLERNDWRPF